MNFDQDDVSHMGFFSWVVPENSLTDDEMFAHLYGFTVEQVIRGVTVEEIMARIIPGDRERVAFECHSSILTGAAGLTTFTVFDGTRYRHIASIGRCLKDIDGVPSFYTGTVFERPRRVPASDNVSMGNVLSFRPGSRQGEPAR